MPTYDYKCLECNYTFEEFQKMTDDPLDECPVCKGVWLRPGSAQRWLYLLRLRPRAGCRMEIRGNRFSGSRRRLYRNRKRPGTIQDTGNAFRLFQEISPSAKYYR